jgi:rhodanese-related sulfurtransferase
MFGWGVKIHDVSVDELASALRSGNPQVIDVREPQEFAAGHVPGAVNIPLGALPSRLSKLDTAAETYVICQHGNRSRSATKLLLKAGFVQVSNVSGGTSAWRGKLER